MGTSVWITIGAAFLSGGGLTLFAKVGLRLIRGDVEREDKRAEAEASRKVSELERLLEEIAQLRLDRNDKEQLVDLLRRELDKALVRGNATLTMARILLAAVDAEELPSRNMIAARTQAQQVINSADEHMKRGN